VIRVIDKDGWRKTFRPQKAIIHIGSAPSNDVVLESWRGEGLAPRHLQLIALPEGYRLVNLGDSDISLGGADGRVISPRSVADVGPGDMITVGDFTFAFGEQESQPVATPAQPPVVERPVSASPVDEPAPPSPPSPPRSVEEPQPDLAEGEEVVEPESQSDVIGLDFLLPQTELTPGRPLEGTVMVSNRGEQTGVQFKLRVTGLGSEHYEIGPGPILFPNAEREVPLRLHHPQTSRPPAGPHRVTVHATAPTEYPGERATASQTVQIEPFYRHTLRLTIDDEAAL
jgi:hypothetical protein